MICSLSSKYAYYGVRRIWQCYERQVSTEYSRVNHKKVQRLMHEMNIQGAGYRKKKAKFNFYPGPNDQTTKNRFRRRFQTDRQLQKLTSDVTEFQSTSNW